MPDTHKQREVYDSRRRLLTGTDFAYVTPKRILTCADGSEFHSGLRQRIHNRRQADQLRPMAGRCCVLLERTRMETQAIVPYNSRMQDSTRLIRASLSGLDHPARRLRDQRVHGAPEVALPRALGSVRLVRTVGALWLHKFVGSHSVGGAHCESLATPRIGSFANRRQGHLTAITPIVRALQLHLHIVGIAKIEFLERRRGWWASRSGVERHNGPIGDWEPVGSRKTGQNFLC